MSDNVLRLEEVSLSFGAVEVFRRLSLGIEAGEFVAVVGPSGCGKSTLLKILAGLLPPTEGSAELRGQPITGPRRDIGVVFQSPVLFPWRTVVGNAMLPADVQGLDKKAMHRRALELLQLVAWAASSSAIRASSPAACSSASASCVRSSTTRRSCSWTSRSAPSTR
jgi:ABC-type nitrate/sulfonate/bicarbonate transport system ATPase subunit